MLNPIPWNFKCVSSINTFKSFDKCNLIANIYLLLFAFHLSEYHDYFHVHTDGSKIINVIGCCIICRINIWSYNVSASFCFFFCWIPCHWNYIKTHFFMLPVRFIIYTDSRSVLEKLQSNSCSPSFISVLQFYNELCNKGFCILF